jgi:galactokinase
MFNQKDIDNTYKKQFGKAADLHVKAPGRINIIGEHTDYNNGFVMPCAIDKYIYFSIGKREDTQLQLFSTDFNELTVFNNVNDLALKNQHWSSHLAGIIKEISGRGYVFETGVNICFGGDIPIGAGLSSSAAIEAGTGVGLNHLFDFNIDKKTLAKIAQDTEHKHIGVKCGIMDMFASIFSQKGSVIQLDCRDLSYQYISANIEGYKFILVDTMVKHTLASSEYNTRRQECETGVAFFNQKMGNIQSLRDVNPAQVKQYKNELAANIYDRCLFVTEEVERVKKAAKALERQDMQTLGKLLNKTHKGLKNRYKVSCKELDFLAAKALTIEGVLGCRMLGGGFGGCTINLIKNTDEADFISKISHYYETAFGSKPNIYSVNMSGGVAVF